MTPEPKPEWLSTKKERTFIVLGTSFLIGVITSSFGVGFFTWRYWLLMLGWNFFVAKIMSPWIWRGSGLDFALIDKAHNFLSIQYLKYLIWRETRRRK